MILLSGAGRDAPSPSPHPTLRAVGATAEVFLVLQRFSRDMTRSSDRIQEVFKNLQIELGRVRRLSNLTGQVGSDRVGSGRGWVGSP